MAKISFCDSIAFYKYVIEQPISKAKVKDLKEKLLEKKDLFFKIDGKAIHLSPIFIAGKNGLYFQIHLDIEIEEFTVKESVWKNIVKSLYDSDYYLVYSGGTGFHIYSRHMHFVSMTEEEYFPAKLKTLMKQKISPEVKNFVLKIKGKSDDKMSLTKMPTIRFGWRREKKNFAVPLIREFNLDSYWVVK
ncbi:MAG: hypothetical protein ABDI07_09970, partial [Candidatus Kryptonium sp.]